MKRERYYIHFFSEYFQKFSVQQFQIKLIIASAMEFRRAWVVDYCSVLIKTRLKQRPFLKYFGDDIISTKAVCDGSNLQHF